MDKYVGPNMDRAEFLSRIVDFFGVPMFVMPALKAAKYHRDSGHPTYFYEFQHRPSIFKVTKPPHVKADHGDELFFVMGAPFLEYDFLLTGAFTEEEKNLSRTVMKYWANFARTGNPNGPGLVHWPQYDQDEGYMGISLEQKAAKHLKADLYEFWTKEPIEKMKEEMKRHTEL